MAHLNGTGPMGQGSQTGRGHGKCRKNETDEVTLNSERRFGRGFRMRFSANDNEQFDSQTAGFGNGRGNCQGRGMRRLHRGN